MSSPFDGQGGRDQWDRRIHGHSEPKIIVLTNLKILVETTDLLKKLSGYHYTGRAHQAEIEAGAENVPRRFAMPFFGVDPYPFAYPYLFRLADLHLRVRLHEGHLNFKLSGVPKVVGVQKTEIISPGPTYSQVTRRRYSLAGLTKDRDSRTEPLQLLDCVVLRPVIHHNELVSFIDLLMHGFDGLTNHRPAIIGRNNDTHQFHDHDRVSRHCLDSINGLSQAPFDSPHLGNG